MEAPVKGPMVLPWPAAAGGLPLKGGSGRPRFRWSPWVQVLAGGFDVTFSSRHLAARDIRSTVTAGHRCQESCGDV